MKFDEGNIVKVLKKTRSDDKGNKKHDLVILLENGSIYQNIQSRVFQSEDENLILKAKDRTFNIPGKIIRTA